MSSTTSTRIVIGTLLVGTAGAMALALIVAPRESSATPAFASRNGKDCGFCHVPGTQGASPPVLNNAGKYFKNVCMGQKGVMTICWDSAPRKPACPPRGVFPRPAGCGTFD
jgi:hypothetical protein